MVPFCCRFRSFPFAIGLLLSCPRNIHRIFLIYVFPRFAPEKQIVSFQGCPEIFVSLQDTPSSLLWHISRHKKSTSHTACPINVYFRILGSEQYVACLCCVPSGDCKLFTEHFLWPTTSYSGYSSSTHTCWNKLMLARQVPLVEFSFQKRIWVP